MTDVKLNQMMDQMIDNSTKAFQSMFWFQEQGEKFAALWMEQNKLTREQAVKIAEKQQDHSAVFPKIVVQNT